MTNLYITIGIFQIMRKLQIDFRLVIVIFSVLLGFLCIRLKLHGWLNILPWSISALIVGYISLNKRDSLINGAVLGYFIFVSYIFFGYKGNTELSQYSRFMIFMLLFSFIGALSGLIGSYIGYLIHKKI
jgi:hypothetical protein